MFESTYRWAYAALCSGLLLTASEGCDQALSADVPDRPSVGGKADGTSADAFPAEADLAVVLPMDDARIVAGEVLGFGWLEQVDDRLANSELGESVAIENFEDDWKLVSMRVTACSPLGTRADADEIDRLCWPEVRLVFQPIIENIQVGHIFRDFYADDRSIHALYRVDPGDPNLKAVLAVLDAGQPYDAIDSTTQSAFESASAMAGLELLHDLAALRGASTGYGRIDTRPELNGLGNASDFFADLREFLNEYCRPDALHELTAFSLPTGRLPAAANLWSFVAFSGQNGSIAGKPLSIHAADDGALLFAFSLSEDVTTGQGDPALSAAAATLDPVREAQLLSQVITNTAQVPERAEQLNDPYQTLVANTSCSSCHRITSLNFNFHNLSYFEDHGLSVAPRVHEDVQRDLSIARALWNSR